MITVFTPTYNRGPLLNKLYESLEQQEYKDFEWIIVDDGSIDETEIVVQGIKEKASFPIIYKKKKNEGKHIAINDGAKLASGEWFFIVDSDDYLSKDALKTVNKYCSEIESDAAFAGVAGLRGSKDGEIWSQYLSDKTSRKMGTPDYFNKQYVDADFVEYKYILRAEGDRAEVVRTDLLRQNPFPKFNNERFLVESFLWIKIALAGYKFRWFNEIVYITEYRDDGLTKNIRQVYINNPIGAYHVSNLQLMCKNLPMDLRIRGVYRYYRYGRMAHVKIIDLWKKCNDKLFSPIGVALALIKR